MLKVYNTLSRKKEEFVPIKKDSVGFYSCGPTVYNFAHIGNLRTYIFNDLLKRTLKYNNLKLNHVMNITDVGHLTGDEDEGEDKMIVAMKREGKSSYDIAEFYTKAFKSDMKKLNIQEPDIWCKATDHIQDMINLIKKIEKNGFTYVSGGNVYFDISKFKDYGKMAKLKLDDLESGSRVELDENKRNPQDFVLWFTKSKFGESHEMIWDSPWGRGFPGWHIECAAMSIKYLGEQFDIHTGGIDHIPIHHTNEIAEAEAATGKKPWVKYWLHGEFLVLEKEKMAKSGGNFIILKTLKDKGYDPLDYRYFCLTAHYKTPLKFTWEALDNAKNSFTRLKNIILDIKNSKESKGSKEKYEKEFLNCVNDDLNIPKALAVLWEVLREDKLGNKEKYELALKFDNIFGLNLEELEEDHVPKEIKELMEKREKLRKEKKFSEADKVREEIKDKGYILEDSKEGIKAKKI